MNLKDSPLTIARIAELEKENGELRAKYMHCDIQKQFLETKQTIMQHDLDQTMEQYHLALKECEDLRDNYLELINAVGCKFADETRHQTALRYILQAEGWQLKTSLPDTKEKQ